MHLIIDGYGGDAQKMQDEELVYRFLDTYPARIGMTKISPPYVCRYLGQKAQDWGISGFVIIAESHISLHTFPERAYVNIDIFSCKEFDADQAIKELQAELGLSEVRSFILKRGLEYYGPLENAQGVAEFRQLYFAAPAPSKP